MLNDVPFTQVGEKLFSTSNSYIQEINRNLLRNMLYNKICFKIEELLHIDMDNINLN